MGEKIMKLFRVELLQRIPLRGGLVEEYLITRNIYAASPGEACDALEYEFQQYLSGIDYSVGAVLCD